MKPQRRYTAYLKSHTWQMAEVDSTPGFSGSKAPDCLKRHQSLWDTEHSGCRALLIIHQWDVTQIYGRSGSWQWGIQRGENVHSELELKLQMRRWKWSQGKSKRNDQDLGKSQGKGNTCTNSRKSGKDALSASSPSSDLGYSQYPHLGCLPSMLSKPPPKHKASQ